MKEEIGNGKVIDVLNNYDLTNIVIEEELFTAKLKQNAEFDKIKSVGPFDIKLNSGRMLFGCNIDNQTLNDDECSIRGYLTKFE